MNTEYVFVFEMISNQNQNHESLIDLKS